MTQSLKKSWKFLQEHIAPNDGKSRKRYDQYVEYYEIKHNLAAEFNPGRILEIGVRAGYSALAFLSACPQAQYVGLDAENNKHGGQGGPWTPWAQKLLAKYDAEIHICNTQQMAEIPHGEFDFIHIDGDHTTKGVMHDLSICLDCVVPGGVMIIDDYDYLNDVRVGVDKFAEAHPDLRTEYRKSLRGEFLFFKD